MSNWTDMTSVALLGTGRGAANISLPGALNELLGESQAEDRLLRAAAILSLAQQGAALRLQSGAAMEIALDEELHPIWEPEIAALLARIIEDNRPSVVCEACECLAATSRCLPARLLPRALEIGRKTVAIREPLRRVLGRRGAWLAAQNAEWSFALLAGTSTLDRRLWEEGDVVQRAKFLAQLRQNDAAAARQMLEASFNQETARDRATLLPSLGENLSLEDELFLNTALANDRSKEVRQVAAGLLSRLPESQFAQRMSARISGCVRIERKLMRTVSTIEPPAAFSADWKDDAIEEKPPAGSKIGERAWWLQQLSTFTPLAFWEQHLNMPPRDLLAVVMKSDWRAPLLAGLRAAANNQPGNPGWTLALLERGGFPHDEAIALALTLSPRDADIALQQILSETDDSILATQAIERADFPWSVELWRIAKKKLPKWLAQQDWRFRNAIALLACRMPLAELADDISWPDLPLFAEAIADFSRILDQRRQLHQLLKI